MKMMHDAPVRTRRSGLRFGPLEWAAVTRSRAGMCVAIAIVIPAHLSFAEEHRHPQQDQEIHEKFYSTWMRPDMPHASCCDNRDCYPTAARFRNGHWEARRREDGAWLVVPDSKVEKVRDNP